MPETAIAYDSVNHVIGMGPMHGRLYAFDPNLGSWTASKIDALGDRSTVFHCMDFDTVDGVYVFIADDFSTWAYKPASQTVQ